MAKDQIIRILLTAGLTFLFFFVFLIILGGALAVVFGTSDSAAADVASQVVSILVYPLVAVVATLLYYDLRIRKEGFDLDVMAEELGAPRGGSGPLTFQGPPL
ncbi:MAG: hypothetical protein H7Z74_06360 [Anaerolineae bacterium]|nr:hypothetical protein [Gemmatimonadaceae bacterium]